MQHQSYELQKLVEEQPRTTSDRVIHVFLYAIYLFKRNYIHFQQSLQIDIGIHFSKTPYNTTRPRLLHGHSHTLSYKPVFQTQSKFKYNLTNSVSAEDKVGLIQSKLVQITFGTQYDLYNQSLLIHLFRQSRNVRLYST